MEDLRCSICKRLLDNPDDPFSKDCGGDCLKCMADSGDPDALKAVAKHYEKARWIIAVGNFTDGFKFIGPFKDGDEAADHAEQKYLETWFVTKLEAP